MPQIIQSTWKSQSSYHFQVEQEHRSDQSFNISQEKFNLLLSAENNHNRQEQQKITELVEHSH